MSNNIRINRLKRELEEVKKSMPLGIKSCQPVSEEDFNQWEAKIEGPKDSPYEGGLFKLSISIPEEYPWKPPNVIFKTRVYHMNISNTGEVCVDILKDGWSPATTISSVLLAVQSLLTDPNPGSPLIPSIAQMYVSQKERHDYVAKKWTEKYAQDQ